MPRLFNKKYIKNKFAYTWYLFVIVALILPLLWIWSFSVMHQPLPFEKVHTFFGASLEDGSIGVKVQDKLGEEKVRGYELTAEKPGTAAFETKFTNIGLSVSDILIIDTEVAKRVTMNDFFISLDDNLKNTYFKTCHEFYTYDKDQKEYGIKFNLNSWTKKYINYDETKTYYMFISKASHGIGKYNETEDPSHTLSLEVAELYLSETI